MSHLDHAPEITDLAAELGIGGGAPVGGILHFCRVNIKGWVAKAGGTTGIDALESLATTQLQMTFEEIGSDEDFDRLTR